MIGKIATIVITFNRKKELLCNIEAQLSQTQQADKLYIIDNCSVDGTFEYLSEKGILANDKIKYCKTDENLGGAGGFNFGLKKAYNDGYDWFILMDDDGHPFDNDCFLNLCKHIDEYNYSATDKLFLNSLVLCTENDMTFGLGEYIFRVDELMSSGMVSNGYIENRVNPFNGTLISRGLIDEIGFPNGDFFIKGDELDYAWRANKVGAIQRTILTSRYYHPKVTKGKFKRILWKKVYVELESPWKEYYAVRNHVYSTLKNSDDLRVAKKLVKRYYFYKLVFIILSKCDKRATYKMIKKGYKDGKAGNLGATVKP